MPFEQKYDAATREAAVDRVLQRRATNPRDRSVLRVVSEEFNVGQQSLRAWVAAAEPASEAATAPRRRRPRFSPVVTSRVERADGQDPALPAEAAPDDAPVAPESVAPSEPELPVAAEPAAAVVALEAEAAALRQGNEALKAAMRVLLGS